MLVAGLATIACALLLVPSPMAQAEISISGGDDDGGAKTVPGTKAKLRDGKAIPPEDAPARVKRAIRAANKIAGKPYVYGGGHASWESRGYDCSGAVSYAIGEPGARWLRSPVPSGSLETWGKSGKGKWVTVYANASHTYVMIAGLRFESHTYGDGPSWSREDATRRGYKVRHKGGY